MSQAANTIAVPTTRFGDLDVDTSKIIDFPKGILGFEANGRFILIEQDDVKPFVYLQSLDDPSLAFIVVEPRLVFPNYKVQIEPQEIADLNVKDINNISMWVIITVPEDVQRMSANLQGPLLINQENNCGKQVVLVRSPYTTRHYLMDEFAKSRPDGAPVSHETVRA
ncbi:MAG: flagellar assembly protein FliW [candidate division Zixibacteria bacterium]|nr:flagellar assembly protein FliW [candidate division Zixibacteria bacterium]